MVYVYVHVSFSFFTLLHIKLHASKACTVDSLFLMVKLGQDTHPTFSSHTRIPFQSCYFFILTIVYIYTHIQRSEWNVDGQWWWWHVAEAR